MDFLQRIGGRKFLMSLITLGVATFVELREPGGVSATFATFLTSLVAAFHIANYSTTARHMDSKSGGRGDDVLDQLSQIKSKLDSSNDPEQVAKLQELLVNIHNSVGDVKQISGQLGTSMLGLGNELRNLKQRT